MSGDETTLAEALNSVGYRTGIFGKWHLGDVYPMRPIDQGFEVSLVHKAGGIGQTPDRDNAYMNPLLWRQGVPERGEGYCTDVFFNEAIGFIQQSGNQPFFLYLALNAPHTPLEVPEPWVEPFRRKGLDETTSRVYAMIANVDENFGRLLATLDRLGIREDTVVLFLGDNGPQQARFNGGLRGRKSSVYEGGVRSLCFLQWKAKGFMGLRVSHRVADIDVFPSLIEAAGLEAEAFAVDGLSLWPLLSERPGAHQARSLFVQCHRGLNPTRYQNAAVIGPRWKLVLNEGSFAKETFRLPDSDTGKVELFELGNDPGEKSDRAGGRPEVVARLLGQYQAWFDSVEASRNFVPGEMVVGSDAENPLRLCRYQDGQFVDGTSQGWPVQVARAGWYEVTVLGRRQSDPAGHLIVSWQDRSRWRWIGQAETSARFWFPEGKGLLDIWVQDDGVGRIRPGDNSETGDVLIERIGLPVGR